MASKEKNVHRPIKNSGKIPFVFYCLLFSLILWFAYIVNLLLFALCFFWKVHWYFFQLSNALYKNISYYYYYCNYYVFCALNTQQGGYGCITSLIIIIIIKCTSTNGHMMGVKKWRPVTLSCC